MKRLLLIDLAEAIKKDCTEKEITQEQLCERTGINEGLFFEKNCFSLDNCIALHR